MSKRDEVAALFTRARLENSSDLVRKARNLAMKHRVDLNEFKGLYCPYCYCLRTEQNTRTRTDGGVKRYCLECKKFYKPIGTHKKKS